MPWRRRRRGWQDDWPKKKSSKSWRSSSSWSLPSVPGLDMLERSILSVDALIGNDPLVDDDLDDGIDNQKLLGSLRGNIVGVQYYDGTVNNYEMVGLVREPNNPYDRNAVRVDNVRKQKVGHLKRQLAAAVSYIMDNKLARVEGIVPSGKNNQYTIPVNLTLWGRPEKQNAVACALANHNIQFEYPGGAMSGVASSSGMASGYQPRTSNYSPQLLTQVEMKNELDSIFDSMKEHDKTSCMEPAKAIITVLYPHQKRALQWMVNQENSNNLPPLWKEKKGQFINIATNFRQTERPPSINGGILADDMGLGKTLEVIALIMTNFCNGKPLAVPVDDFTPKAIETSKKANCQVDTVFEKPVFDVKTKEKEMMKTEVKGEMLKMEVKEEMVKTEVKEEIMKTEVKEEEKTVEEEEPVKAGKGGKKKGKAPRKKRAVKEKKGKKVVLNDVTEVDNLTSNPTATAVSPVRRRPKRNAKRPAKYTYSDDEVLLEDVLSPKKSRKIKSTEEKSKCKAPAVQDDEWTPPSEADEPVEMDMFDNHWDDVVPPTMHDDLPLVPPTAISTVSADNGGGSVVSSNAASGNDATLKDLPALPSLSSELTSLPPASTTTSATDSNVSSVVSSRMSGCTTIDDDLPLLPSLPTGDGFSVASKLSIGRDSTGVSCASASSVKKLSKPLPIVIDDCTTPGVSVDLTTSSVISSIPKEPSEHIVLTDDDDDDDDDDLPDIQLAHKAPSRTYTKGPRPTLIVCPLSVISNWLQQLKEHVHPHVDIRVYLYYGPDRVRDSKVLMSKDIVITTYNTLAMDYKAKQERSVLHTTHWLRVVLDEGHMIRNPSALQSKAAIALKSDRRWVLTGTPIQNSMRDLWSLTVFLKLEPFCSDRQWWKRVIARPIAEGNKAALGRVQALMRAIALRRTKTQKVNGKPLVELPERNVFVQSVELSEEERKVYDTMAREGRLAIGRYFRAGTLLHHYGDVLSILLRLRQLCCHPGLCNRARAKAEIEALIDLNNKEAESTVVTDEAKKKLVEKLLNVLSQGADEECCVCLESLRLPVITACAHVFCRPCIEEVIKKDQEAAACPLCRADVKDKDLVEVPEDKIEPPKPVAGPWQSSAKVDAMMQHLIDLQRDDPTVKSLVVSQFTSLLDLVQKPLTDIGIKFVCFDGRMSMKKRTETLEAFSKQGPDSPTVCLLSLKAGGVGVNLVAASRVFLLDPAWNPASEEQCFDRCHRLGQTRDVIVTKFIVKDSVEERMMDLQEKKRNLMAGAFGKKKQSAEERQRTRINDIKLLMDL